VQPTPRSSDVTDPAIEDLLRELAPQVLGALVRRYGQFDQAEDAVQEALLAAAEQWSRDVRRDLERINDLIHAVAIVLVLPHLLEKGERITDRPS
jgi:DNA-directed RNA polymerase specialized sigma24 family protein